jgi:hypothetical protein
MMDPPISPELALVDADIARTTAEERTQGLSAEPSASGAAAARISTRDAVATRVPPNGRRRRRVLIAALAALLAVLVATAALLSFGWHSAAPPASSTNAATPPHKPKARSLPRTHRAVPTPQRDVTISWPAAKRADVYNLVLLRGRKRIDLWPVKNTAKISTSTGNTRLATGTYRWYVYAGARTGKRVRYGALLAHGTVRIPTRGARQA